MIGQDKLLSTLSNLIETQQLPRFLLLVGQKGGGKKTIAHHIANCTGFGILRVGIKIDDIRTMINDAYALQTPMIYIIEDADAMSETAKNSLLKVCEEPPNNAYIIMTLNDDMNTLATIKSRAQVFYLDKYTRDDLVRYYKENFNNDTVEINIIQEICETPGQVKDLARLGIVDFDNYVDLVFHNIHIVSMSNAFKIGLKLNLDKDDNKYPLNLFFRAFIIKCMDNLKENPKMYGFGIQTTSKYLQELRYVNLNKSMLFDSWLLDIRNGWSTYAESYS